MSIWEIGQIKPKTQNKLNCYVALNHGYKLADYLLTVRDTQQRWILTKHRVHRLAIGQRTIEEVRATRRRKSMVTA